MRVLVGLLLFASVCSSVLSDSVDKTIEDKAVGPEVVEATLDRVWGSCAFPNDKLYLRRIAKVESNDGSAAHTFTQNGKDFYGGIWQVTEQSFRNTLKLTTYFDIIKKDFDIEWSKVQWTSLVKPLYSAIAASLFIQSTLASGAEIPISVADQGRHWATDYHPGGNETAFTRAADQLLGGEDCESDVSDIMIVMDGSGSIGAGNFEVAREFARNISLGFNIGEDLTRIGLIQYSSKAHIEFELGKYATKTTVSAAITAMKYLTGGTNSAEALKTMKAQFDNKGRSSTQGIPRVGIFLTDGKSSDKAATEKQANIVHQGRTSMYSVGIGSNLDAQELDVIGSEPSCNHVFKLANFNEMQHFQAQLKKQTCSEPSELEEGEEIEGEVVTMKRKYFKLKIKKNKKGLTIKVKMGSGSTRLYISYKVRNPSKLIHDYKIDINTVAKSGGAIYLPWRGKDKLDHELVYAALEGTGVGMRNKFKLQALDGFFPNAAGREQMSFLALAFSALVALWFRVR